MSRVDALQNYCGYVLMNLSKESERKLNVTNVWSRFYGKTHNKFLAKHLAFIPEIAVACIEQIMFPLDCFACTLCNTWKWQRSQNGGSERGRERNRIVFRRNYHNAATVKGKADDITKFNEQLITFCRAIHNIVTIIMSFFPFRNNKSICEYVNKVYTSVHVHALKWII